MSSIAVGCSGRKEFKRLKTYRKELKRNAGYTWYGLHKTDSLQLERASLAFATGCTKTYSEYRRTAIVKVARYHGRRSRLLRLRFMERISFHEGRSNQMYTIFFMPPFLSVSDTSTSNLRTQCHRCRYIIRTHRLHAQSSTTSPNNKTQLPVTTATLSVVPNRHLVLRESATWRPLLAPPRKHNR